MLKSSTIIEFLSVSTHASKSLCLIYFNAIFSGPLKFIDWTTISLLIITFINIKWLSLPYLRHIALNFTLFICHIVFPLSFDYHLPYLFMLLVQKNLLLSLLFGNTNMEWRHEMSQKVTCTNLAALVPCSWLNREVMVPEHVQSWLLSCCLCSWEITE